MPKDSDYDSERFRGRRSSACQETLGTWRFETRFTAPWQDCEMTLWRRIRALIGRHQPKSGPLEALPPKAWLDAEEDALVPPR